MKKLILAIMIWAVALNVNAQSRTSIAVINVESNGLNIRNSETTNLVRIELGKLDKFYVADNHDIESVVKKDSIDLQQCTGKICLYNLGKELRADKVLTGSITKINKKLIIELRIIDINDSKYDKTQTEEFLALEDQIQNMLHICLSKMFDQHVDQSTSDLLKKNENLDNSVNNPGVSRLVLSGPRIGMVMLTGDVARRMADDKRNGGWEAYPVMTVFGYQHEIQYLNEGSFQALFEFVGTIGGLDQNMFNPSISILDGFRSNVDGWEFALGPNFSFAPTAKGYYDDGGHWVRLTGNETAPAGKKIIDQLDSRGAVDLSTSFVFSVGKSFRSGKMNIPLNFFVIPKRDGWRMGLSFGFNAKRREM